MNFRLRFTFFLNFKDIYSFKKNLVGLKSDHYVR